MRIPERADIAVPSDPCEREVVHTIGRIQSHGLLFVLSEPDYVVRQVSINVHDMLRKQPDTVLGQPFEAILGERQFAAFRTQAAHADEHLASPLRFHVGRDALPMNCLTHRQSGALIVELELVHGAHALEPLDFDAHVRVPVARIQAASGVVELSRVVASEIRRLSAFDRVMVYRFDEEWNGEVIAEVAGSWPVSYLGHRFPASDIPAQVRRLFLINPLRTIADIATAAVPIVPDVDPASGTALDLTRSHLRSAAPIHLEYLRNMGVAASMTVSIIVENELWGMIACHHPVAHRVAGSTRAVCELIGQVFSAQLSWQIDNQTLQTQIASRALLEHYMAGVEESGAQPEGGYPWDAGLMELVDADGLIASVDGLVSYRGTTVGVDVLQPAVMKLKQLATRGIASSNMLTALDAGAARFASEVSGLLYVGLAEPAGDYLLFLRREVIETITWAGDPRKDIEAGREGGLRPRASFAAWKETVRQCSLRWTALELENARFLREQLLRVRESHRVRESEKRVRYLAHHDALTGLVNRRSIELKLEEFVKTAEAERASFAVLFVDLDRFKHYNDSLGHDMGDRILTIVARRMKSQLRPEDVIGRLGGDEFIVLLLGVLPEADVSAMVARLHNAIEEPMELVPGVRVNVSASIGLSRYPQDGTTSEVLVRQSDMAMYRAKRSGGSAFEHH